MAWTPPMNFQDGQVLTAAQLNNFVRDNLLETMPAKATGFGAWMTSDGYGRVAERAVVHDNLLVNGITESSSYDDLSRVGDFLGTPSIGPQVTVATGTTAMVVWGGSIVPFASSPTVTAGKISVSVSGATEIPADDLRALIFRPDHTTVAPMYGSMVHWFTDLNPGTNTFTCKYAIGSESGIVAFNLRRLAVIPF